MEAKDPYIKKHLRSVSDLALRIGREISLPEEQMEALANGALLHDVGKIGIPDRILQKSVRLTEEEYTEIKQHPALGVGILTPVEELASALPVVKHHHERFDGKGYPDGLRGEDIPLIARIVSVADAFDSMIRARPYGYGVSSEAALKEIEENSGTQFDPRIVRRAAGGRVRPRRTPGRFRRLTTRFRTHSSAPTGLHHKILEEDQESLI